MLASTADAVHYSTFAHIVSRVRAWWPREAFVPEGPVVALLEHTGKEAEGNAGGSAQLGSTPAAPAVCLPDPVPNFTMAMVWMATAMTVVIALGYLLTLVGAGAARQGDQAHGRVPKMVVLDAVRAWLVFNIIQGHQGTDFHVGATSHGLVVMSGFLLAATQGTKRQSYDLRGAAAFAAHRLARLTPGYYMLLIITAAVTFHPKAHHTVLPLVGWPLAALFSQSMIPTSICIGSRYYWIPWVGPGHTWYVSMTMLHALLFPWLFNWIRATTSSPASVAVALGLLLAVKGGLDLCKDLHLTKFGMFELAHANFMPFRIFDLVAGMLAARAVETLQSSTLQWRVWNWLLPFSVPLAILSEMFLPHFWAVTAAWCAFLFISRCAAETVPEWRSSWDPFDRTLQMMQHFVISAGRYSWGAYLYQYLALMLVNLVWPHRPDVLRWVPGVVAFFLAVPADKFLDAPVARVVRQRLQSGRAPVAK